MSHSKNYVTDNRLNRCFTIHQEWFSPIPTKEDLGGGGRTVVGINEFRQLERRGKKFMQRLQYAEYLTFWIVIPHFLFLGVWLLDWLQAVSWPLPWTSLAVFDLNFTFPPRKAKITKNRTFSHGFQWTMSWFVIQGCDDELFSQMVELCHDG